MFEVISLLMKKCPRCGRLIRYGRAYCPTCEKQVSEWREKKREEAKKKYMKKYNKQRDPKYGEFYRSKAWRSLKAYFLAAHGYRCERCGAIAEVVHHKQRIQTPDGWERRLDPTNLELLCNRCHNDEHNRFGGKKRDPGGGRKSFVPCGDNECKR